MKRWVSALIALGTLSGPLAVQADNETPPSTGDRYGFSCVKNELCARRLFMDFTGLSNKPEAGSIIKWTRPMDLRMEHGSYEERPVIEDALREAHDAAVRAGFPDDKSGDSREQQPLPVWVFFGGELSAETADGDSLRSQLALKTWKGLKGAPGRPCWSSLELEPSTLEPRGAALRLRMGADAGDAAICAASVLLRVIGFPARTQASGFESLLTENQPAISDGARLISTLDRIMLRLLYDPAIEPGMGMDAVDTVFPTVYARQVPKIGGNDRKVDAELLDPIDQTTYACMTDRLCALDHFLQMTIIGTDLEPPPRGRRLLSKAVLPSIPRVIFDERVGEVERDVADRALGYVSTIAQLVGIPFLPVTDEDSWTYTTYFQFVTPDPEGARDVDFADWISQAAGVSPMYDRAVTLLDGNQCAGVTEENLLGYGTTKMVAMIPTGDRVTPRHIARCVIEETLQGFGLPFDIDSGVKTLFDDRGDKLRITAFDLFMFSILYHPSIEPGMTADDVRAVFDEVYNAIWARFAADRWWMKEVDPS